MPSHASPPESEASTRWWVSRRRKFRRTAPVAVGGLTAIFCADSFLPTGGGDIASVVLGIVRVGILGGILAVVLISVILTLDAYAQKLSLRLTTARPRWQYALFALGYGAITGIGVLTGMHDRSGWLVNVTGLFVIWSSAITLAMLGRAVCWGGLRRACWWHRPQWLG